VFSSICIVGLVDTRYACRHIRRNIKTDTERNIKNQIQKNETLKQYYFIVDKIPYAQYKQRGD